MSVVYETELKLRVAPEIARDVVGHPAIEALKDGRVRTARLYSVYFDTPDLRLAAAGVSVRIRRDGSRWLQTVKGNATSASGGGLAQRIESEWPLGRSPRRPALDAAKLASSPCAAAIAEATRDAPLAPMFVTDFMRTEVPLRFDARTTATLCVDTGSLHAGSRPAKDAAKASLSEVEIELREGDAALLFELALTLAEDLPLAVETRSKAARGYALVTPPIHRPVTAEPLDYAETAPAGSALSAILRNTLAQIESNAEGLARSDEVEWVHQMRVGVRRARCAMALLRRLVADDATASVEDALRWIAGVLGDVRDLDVFTTQTLRELGPAAERTYDANTALPVMVADLHDRALTAAAAARADARTAIASPRFAQLVLGMGRIAALLDTREEIGASDASSITRPARAFASEVLERRYRKLRRAARDLDRSSAARHDARIDAKKLRYAAEFFAPSFPAKRARKFVDALVAFQRELGAANDAAVAAYLAQRLAPDSPSAALVIGWTSAQQRRGPRRMRRAWRDVERAKPFWNIEDARDDETAAEAVPPGVAA